MTCRQVVTSIVVWLDVLARLGGEDMGGGTARRFLDARFAVSIDFEMRVTLGQGTSQLLPENAD